MSANSNLSNFWKFMINASHFGHFLGLQIQDSRKLEILKSWSWSLEILNQDWTSQDFKTSRLQHQDFKFSRLEFMVIFKHFKQILNIYLSHNQENHSPISPNFFNYFSKWLCYKFVKFKELLINNLTEKSTLKCCSV